MALSFNEDFIAFETVIYLGQKMADALGFIAVPQCIVSLSTIDKFLLLFPLSEFVDYYQD